MSDHIESTAAADTCSLLYRNDDDAFTVELRKDQLLSLEELVHLKRSASRAGDTASSLGSRTTSVFSSRKESSVTKPTSAGTSYVIDDKVATYASSVSATYGSASEAETDHDTALVGIGDQFDSDSVPLSGLGKRSQIKKSRAKCKKPVLVIHHEHPLPSSEEDETHAIIHQSSRRSGKGM